MLNSLPKFILFDLEVDAPIVLVLNTRTENRFYFLDGRTIQPKDAEEFVDNRVEVLNVTGCTWGKTT